MTEGRFFADVSLPFHVWVREKGERGPRWVLREAAHLREPQRPRAASEGRAGAGGAPSS